MTRKQAEQNTALATTGAYAIVMAPLNTLAIAPENMRAKEGADEDIPELAETIDAAGVLVPLFARPGKGSEADNMVLDGRRRFLALTSLREAGRIAEDHPVPIRIVTDKAAIAAATILTNTERAEIHPADLITAIGKLRSSRKMTPAQVAKALGSSESQIKRLDALSTVHPAGIAKFRAGDLDMDDLRKLSRVPDKAEQGRIAELAQGHYSYSFDSALERALQTRIDIDDPRFGLTTLEAYLAVGGRVEQDLFDELPDMLLDPAKLEDVYVQALGPVKAEANASETAGNEMDDEIPY